MAFEASFCDRHSLQLDTCAIHGVTLRECGPATRKSAAIADHEKFSLECPEPACSFVVFLTEEKQHIKRKAKI
jgi:hypothetical protein